MSKKEFVEKFKKSKELKKSYEYPETTVLVETMDQAASENVDPKFLKSLQEVFLKSERFAVESMALGEGLLVLSQTDKNLFNGFYKDIHGQITEKFSGKTIEMVAKALLVKSLVILPEIEEVPVEPVIEEPQSGYVRLKFGDFEFEMKKSITKDFPQTNRRDLKKAVQIWKKSSDKYTGAVSTRDSLKELTENWEIHQEKFNQILFGVQKQKKK
jgi:hypothetical protein